MIIKIKCVNIFYQFLTVWTNKLKCLNLACFYASLIFMNRVGAYPKSMTL